jgi:hypothetical protein
MHDFVVAGLERPQQRREHCGGTRLGIVQQHNSAPIGLDAAKNEP